MPHLNSDYSRENYLTRQCYSTYQDLYEEINNKDSGILYTVIKKIIQEKGNHDEILKNISNNYNIREDAELEDDLEVLGDIVVLFLSKPDEISRHYCINFLKKPVNELRKFTVSRFEDKDMKLYQIVTGALVFAGVYFATEAYTNSKKNKNVRNVPNNRHKETGQTLTSYTNKEEQSIHSNQRLSKPEQEVALCLVVPAFVVSKLRKNGLINVSEIENLIDNASHFLCTELADANLIQHSVQLMDEELSTIGERTPVYLKIRIDGGEAMLDKKVPYSLKSNLPLNCDGIIEQLSYLRNLSGLEAFNRI